MINLYIYSPTVYLIGFSKASTKRNFYLSSFHPPETPVVTGVLAVLFYSFPLFPLWGKKQSKLFILRPRPYQVILQKCSLFPLLRGCIYSAQYPSLHSYIYIAHRTIYHCSLCVNSALFGIMILCFSARSSLCRQNHAMKIISNSHL